MAIELGLYKRIRRLYNEGHSERHIARILRCSRKSVKKYCQGELPHDALASTPSKVDPPLRQALEKELLIMIDENKALPRKQRRTAKTMWKELTKKGFTVGESTIRRHVRLLVQKHPEAFVPLYFEPGEAMQVDWGDAKAWIEGVNTGVSVFVTILPYSYALYASVFPTRRTLLSSQVMSSRLSFSVEFLGVVSMTTYGAQSLKALEPLPSNRKSLRNWRPITALTATFVTLPLGGIIPMI